MRGSYRKTANVFLSVGLTALLIFSFLAMGGVGVGLQGGSDIVYAADSVTTIEGNATCSQLVPGTIELKVEPVSSGTFSDGTLTVVLTVSDSSFSFTSNIGVDAVFVKGGPGGLLYLFDPEATSGSGLHAPTNPDNGQFYGLSHVSFCYDVETTTTTVTGTTTTATTETTTGTTTTGTTTTGTTTTVTGTTTTATTEEGRVCVEHWANGELRNINFLPENSDVVKDVIAEGGKRIRGNEFWQLCTTTTTTTVTGTTTTGTTTTGTTTTVTGTTTTATTEEGRVCVEHWANGELRNINFLPENSDVVKDVIAEGGKRIRGNEFWQLCQATTTTTTVTGTTTTVPGTTTTTTVAGTTVTVSEEAQTSTVAGAVVVVTPPAVVVTAAAPTVVSTPGAVTVAAAAPTVVSTPAAVTVEAAPEVVTVAGVTSEVPAAVVAGVEALPRAGGVPMLPSALAGLGLLFAAAGIALRRFVR